MLAWIALLLLLLSSASTVPATRSNCLTPLVLMIDHQKLTELLRRNHYDYDFNTLRYQNLIDKGHFTTIDIKRVNRNAIRYKYNPPPYSTRTVQANMPSLAKGKPSSAIKNATTKVKEKESTDKPTRPTKAQLAREAQAKKDAELDAILEKDWRVDFFDDRKPKAYDKSSGSSEYSGLDDDSSEWTIDNEDENKTDDKPPDEEPEARKMKKNKPAEGEDSDERHGSSKGGKPEMATPKPRLVTMSKQSLMRTKLALEEEDLSSPDKMILQSPKRRTDSRKRIMPNTPPVAQRLRRLKKISKTTPRPRLLGNQGTRKTVIPKSKNASDKVQRKAVVNPYTPKGDKKAITFGGNEIRYFEKNNEDLNFSQLDSLQLEDYDNTESPTPTDQTTTNKETSWPKTGDEDQDLLGILSPYGPEESEAVDTRIEHNQLLEEIDRCLDSDPGVLLQDHRQLMFADFEKLAKGTVNDKRLWVAEFHAARSLARHVGTGTRVTLRTRYPQANHPRMQTVRETVQADSHGSLRWRRRIRI